MCMDKGFYKFCYNISLWEVWRFSCRLQFHVRAVLQWFSYSDIKLYVWKIETLDIELFFRNHEVLDPSYKSGIVESSISQKLEEEFIQRQKNIMRGKGEKNPVFNVVCTLAVTVSWSIQVNMQHQNKNLLLT